MGVGSVRVVGGMAAGIAMMVTAGGASAQGFPPFNGLYFGAHVGASILDADFEFDARANRAGLNSFQGDDTNTGAFGGGFIGYGATTGSLYLGAEFDGGISGANGSFTDNQNGVLIEGTYEQDYSIAFSGRIGYLAQPNLMVYARAGFAIADFDFALRDNQSQVSDDEQINGARFGFGVDYGVTNQLFARAEYTYTMYGDDETIIDTVTDNRANFDVDEHLLRFGVGYLF